MSIPHHPALPAALRSWASPASARGSPTPLLRPGAICGGKWGRWLPVQPSPLRSAPTGSDPSLLSQSWGVSPCPGTQTGLPRVPGIPFPHCGYGDILNSRAPCREGGRGSTNLAEEVEGCRSWCQRKKGDLGPLRARKSIPGPWSKPLSHRPRHQRIQNLAGRYVSPGEGDRPIPVTQKPAFPRPPGPQHSKAPFLLSAPPPSVFTHAASGNLRTQIPFPPHQKPARDWPLARISRAFWFPPQSDLSSTLSFLPYPQASFSLPKPLTSPTRICTWRSRDQSRKPLQGFHYLAGSGKR